MDSIPDGVISIFCCLNPSGRTIALGSIQPVTNEYQGHLDASRRPVRRVDNLANFMCLGASTSCKSKGL